MIMSAKLTNIAVIVGARSREVILLVADGTGPMGLVVPVSDCRHV